MESDVSSGGNPGSDTDPDAAWSPLAALDALDRQIVHALQVDGRAPFNRLAQVLGVSDQTVARRYARLRREGAVRVLGLTDPLRLGLTPWLVRVRCTPDAAASIGEALARRTDTRWVSLTSGGTEIFCVTHAARAGEADALLLQKLPRTPRVVGVAAHALLHVFFGGDHSPVSRTGPLGPDEIRALTAPDAPARPPDTSEPVRLGPADHRMLEVLAIDGRTSAADLATATGWSQTTVRRRLSELRSCGALYYDLDFGGGRLFPELRTGLWLEVDPACLAEVGAALAGHHQIAFAAAITGNANVYASLTCKDPEALYRYLTGPIAALPGLRRTETAPIHRLLKGAGPFPL
ncbi:DNA-binding transcriptional regulator, Lrp family [Actinacidiphila yanglinensis]|uniref:DNA-binding transcriptional regulator, Lrp family n=1 Tax=Actinacidiphila yanglinensis TaxID=310779 RepID=A0A1H6DLR5_9ACTN|nr:Lrp/AsnC family transcriptional regulator [Actinacidiphila yanglinensis]SEG86138.1 DNA-binding transcriptional regulator, Lrp family [Actinacidiphila yanglinensis]